MSKLRQIETERFFLLIDKMEEDGVLVSSAHGYRLTKNCFNELRKNPNAVREEIRIKYIDYTVEPTALPNKNNDSATNRIEDNRNRIEYRLVKESSKCKEEDEILSLRPRLGSNNLAVDIVTVIAFNLMGDRFKKGTRLPSWISISEIIKNLQENWVFIG